jgi:hypothetical protein
MEGPALPRELEPGANVPQDLGSGIHPRPAGAAVEDFRLHDLRHHAASVGIGSGTDVRTVSLPGPGRASIALDMYAHLLSANLQAVAERMETQAAREVREGRGGDGDRDAVR